jgi:PAS domain S-box-containing protein
LALLARCSWQYRDPTAGVAASMRRQLERLIDEGPALYLVVDATGSCLEARGAWQALLGLSPDVLLGKRFDVVLHPDDVEPTLRAHAEAFRSARATAHYEARCRHADGSYRWISWTAPPTENGIGVAIGIDVTKRRLELAELNRTRSELQSVLETVPFYVTLTDTRGIIAFINRTYPGVTREQVVGTHLLNWLPPESREQMKSAYARVLGGEDRVEFLGQGSGPNGPAWYRSILGAVKQDGQVVSVVVVGDDITELKHSEERGRRAARLEAIGQVSSAIAHDFGNLLTVMYSQVELLRAEFPALPDGAQELIVQLEGALDGARALTRDIMQAVRQRRSTAAQVELVSSLNDLLRFLQAAAGRAMRLTIHCELEHALVALAPHELQQLLINLVVNSRDATRGVGSVAILVDLFEVHSQGPYWPGPGSYARIRVDDDGPGIPSEQRERVLEPFFTTKPQGGGLGLATCFSLVRERGGDLQIEESPSGGVSVVILLPILPNDPIAPELTEPSVDAASTSVWTILLADDEDMLRVNIARFLTRLGHRVLEARDGLDAIEMYERHPGQIDVVVSDLTMPRRDGAWLLTELRARQPALPLIAMTGSDDPGLHLKLAALGAHLLLKPATPADLLQVLEQATQALKLS